MNATVETLSLKGARVENGYTQKQIADKLGVSREQYIKWENGKVIPRNMVIYALSYIYKIDSDTLRVTPKKFLP